jgi:hypothetical protein
VEMPKISDDNTVNESCDGLQPILVLGQHYCLKLPFLKYIKASTTLVDRLSGIVTFGRLRTQLN